MLVEYAEALRVDGVGWLDGAVWGLYLVAMGCNEEQVGTVRREGSSFHCCYLAPSGEQAPLRPLTLSATYCL